MIAILGSGFGLYGYLPALVEGCGQRVVLPESYRASFRERPELGRFAGAIEWKRSKEEALDFADGVVIALPPEFQSEWITRCLARPNLERLLLEKPLAPSPEAAARLHSELVVSKKMFRMGYTFRYTSWGKQIRRPISIRWNFRAHHFVHALQNWKRFDSSGGGALRFYGIQVIALLAELGYNEVSQSRSSGPVPEELVRWNGTFRGAGLPICEVAVDTDAASSCFRVEAEAGSVSVDARDPFDLIGASSVLQGLDRRVPVLIDLCYSFLEQAVREYSWYEAAIKLWQRVEEKTEFERV